MIDDMSYRRILISIALLMIVSFETNAQVTITPDTTSIMIGDQIKLEIKVETDSINNVIFPQGQTFSPLELVEVNDTDTLFNKEKVTYTKIYNVTQFDSGFYTLPKQKIIIGDQIIFTDSLKTEFRGVKVDTTKQKLFNIKPKNKVSKSYPKLIRNILILIILLIVSGLIFYFFVLRKKPLTQEEKMALLPSYERAKLAIKSINEKEYIKSQNIKGFYSDLTYALKKYVDEKVFPSALECTTDEFILKLNATINSGKIGISKSSISSIETVLKRADLVKFAKSIPDHNTLEGDRLSFDEKIDEIKNGLPEPSEEEKLRNLEYKKLQEKKRLKELRYKVAAGILAFLVTLFLVFGFTNGFKLTIDKIFQNKSLKQLNKEWVYSEYGVPSIQISTPNVLIRDNNDLVDSLKGKVQVSSFKFGKLNSSYSVKLSTKMLPKSKGKAEEVDLIQTAENVIQSYENNGGRDIILKQEQFITPNAAEGLKTFGTMNVPDGQDLVFIHYVLLQFTADNLLQQIELTYRDDDSYANEIIDKIIETIELKKDE
mgnify:FL=1